MKKPNILRAAILAAVLTPAIATAAGFEAYLSVPFNKYGELKDSSDELLDSVGGSLSAGYRFDNPFGVELTYARADSGIRHNQFADVNVQSVGLDGLYHFAESDDLSPFVLLGVSDYQYDYDIAGISGKDAQTAIDLGLGLKKYVTDNFVIRTEAKVFRTLEQSATHAALSVGFGFALGHKAAAPAAPVAAAPVAAAPLDSDNDGVTDDLDKCPGTAAKLKVDAVGCPIILKENVNVSLQVLFDTNSDVVKPEFDSEVKKVADFLEQYQGTTAEIEGHTDSRGSNALNKTLSQKRADAIVKVLVEKFGVSAARLKAVGYGEEQLIVKNDKTAAEQAQNRRVIGKISAVKEVEATK
ncbi:MAG: OmpA domain protein [Pseudomonadota bacterium]|jgi:OOP family OmpA-OmpF porin